jgi:hypothetical protein
MNTYPQFAVGHEPVPLPGFLRRVTLDEELVKAINKHQAERTGLTSWDLQEISP